MDPSPVKFHTFPHINHVLRIKILPSHLGLKESKSGYENMILKTGQREQIKAEVFSFLSAFLGFLHWRLPSGLTVIDFCLFLESRCILLHFIMFLLLLKRRNSKGKYSFWHQSQFRNTNQVMKNMNLASIMRHTITPQQITMRCKALWWASCKTIFRPFWMQLILSTPYFLLTEAFCKAQHLYQPIRMTRWTGTQRSGQNLATQCNTKSHKSVPNLIQAFEEGLWCAEPRARRK